VKSLILVRHAKSSRDDPTLADRERPLNKRGLHDAPAMGKRLASRHGKLDLIRSSPALRALTTAQLIADEIDYKRENIVVDERLYASSAENLLAIVRALDDKLDRIMLVGHNPEFSEFAHRLSSDVVDLATCAVAEFQYDSKSWRDVGEVTPSRVRLDAPKK
jgi:phosphohistidine phosphatase